MANSPQLSHMYSAMKKTLSEQGIVIDCEEANREAIVFESTDSNDDIARLLRRVGILRGTSRGKAKAELVIEIAETIGTESGDAIDFVRHVLHLYSGTNETEEHEAICGAKPRCEVCGLAEICRHFNRRPTIKQLPADERPRERLIGEGPEALTDAELLGILIKEGTPRDTAVDLARRLLVHYGNFRSLSNKTIGELCQVKGIGPAKAATIKAALEIARRFGSEAIKPGAKIQASEDIYRHYREKLIDKKQETFLAILLDSKHRVIRDEMISSGSLTASIVHPREVFKPAVRESAASVIFVHNHPSGDPNPSAEDKQVTERLKETGNIIGIAEDKQVTERLKETGNIIGIKVLDHIIIGAQSYVSFADLGML